MCRTGASVCLCRLKKFSTGRQATGVPFVFRGARGTIAHAARRRRVVGHFMEDVRTLGPRGPRPAPGAPRAATRALSATRRRAVDHATRSHGTTEAQAVSDVQADRLLLALAARLARG